METKRWNLNYDHFDDDDILHFAPNMKTIKTIKMKTQFLNKYINIYIDNENLENICKDVWWWQDDHHDVELYQCIKWLPWKPQCSAKIK